MSKYLVILLNYYYCYIILGYYNLFLLLFLAPKKENTKRLWKEGLQEKMKGIR